MKISKLVLSVLLLTVMNAVAEIPSIPKNTQAETVANTANDIFSVQHFKIGIYAYKVVQMDSILNGDISTTTMVLVGENGVGGLAGYAAAFQLSPTEARNSLSKAKVSGGKLELTFSDLLGVKTKVRVLYNPATQTLTEY
jgi:hypothetical protein